MDQESGTDTGQESGTDMDQESGTDAGCGVMVMDTECHGLIVIRGMDIIL